MSAVSPGATSGEHPRALVQSVTVFFPAFNDAPSLPRLIATTFEVLSRRVDDYEVVVVNDGSSDATSDVLTDLQVRYGSQLRVVTHTRNRGYGAALSSGFNAATKDWVFYTDGDGQYDPSELALLIDAVGVDTGLVNGYKVERQDPWYRVAIGSVYNRLSRALFRIRIRDIDCDFRLIRRDLLQNLQLQSTSGTICLELVKKLERSGAGIAEVPVSHHPRLHGRSQFFRIQSLASTFFQLCSMFWALVLLPSLLQMAEKDGRESAARERPSRTGLIVMAAALLCLGLVTYGRALTLPFIADDYVQIELGRENGPMSKWGHLAADALYRCRATSLVMTYWTEKLFGVNAFAFNASSLVVHVVNCFLVFLLGLWRPIGWRVSALAAAIFAVGSQKQEAVMWYAALPELLAFTFGISSLLCFLVWVQSRSVWSYLGSVVLFVLALLSKESVVALVPLMAGALLYEGRRKLWKRTPAIAPFAALSVLYFLLAFGSRETHLHFNDGTFSLAAPFWIVVRNSVGRLLWVWGLLAIAALLFWRAWRWRTVLGIAAVWMIVTLLPYSFLTYMPRVPSRHTYFASVGLCFIVAAGLLELWRRAGARQKSWVAVALGAVILTSEVAYIWTKKHEQFVRRAAPTEQLVSIVDRTFGPVYLKCFPYDESVAILAVRYRAKPDSTDRAIFMGKTAVDQTEAVDLCNEATGRGRF